MQKNKRCIISILLVLWMAIISLSPEWTKSMALAAPYPANSSFEFATYEYHSNKQVGTYSDYNVDSGFAFAPKTATGELQTVIFLHGNGAEWPSTPEYYRDAVEKWIKKGYIAPFVMIMPNLAACGFDGFVYTDQTGIGGERELMGELVSRIENGTFDNLTGVTLKKTDLTLCGYSLGGGVAILGGSYYRDKFVNVGSLSPGPQVHYPTSTYGSWMDKFGDKTKDADGNYKFTDNPNRHLFIGYSMGEDIQYRTVAENCYTCFKESGYEFAKSVCDSGKHNANLFKIELFCYLYYLQNDVMPSDNDIKNALDISTVPVRTITMPSPVQQDTISGTVKLSVTNFAYGFNVHASSPDCNCKNLAFQWYRGDDLISGAMFEDYTITVEDIGCQLTCVITDATGKLKGSIKATSPVVQKCDGPNPPTGLKMTPCTKGRSDGRIDGVTTEMEYDTNNGFTGAKTCPANAITGLSAGTYYVRYKETASAKHGALTEIKITELYDGNLAIDKKNLRLQDTIAIEFWILKSAIEGKYHDPYLLITQNGTQKTLTEFREVSNRLVFTYRVVPYMLEDVIIAEPHALNAAGRDIAGAAMEYSAAEYCYNMLGKEEYSGKEYATFRRLLVDILRYGDAAQVYTNYRTSYLASAKLTSAQKAMGTDVQTPMTYESVKKLDYATVSSADQLVTIDSVALMLKSAVNIRFRYVTSRYDGLRLVVSEDASGTKVLGEYALNQALVDESGAHYAETGCLDACKMRKTIYATVMQGTKKVGNTCRYSIESYAASKKNGTDPKLDNLLDAMMRYGDSAADYSAGK